ncbi:hypothetical protein CBR_g46456 [Chara braunii]|uniref:Uncharacterized protein n=1 Tax=Chara braunii TaxID=69332 RepID=A0A388M0P5_CHABU|nr:hypothetical protein CBR_g46456 [Chara braunii]|eukprot:GBG88085.1 hypothetical protein CBR_g46456 [Chara braunii]
MRGSFLIVGSTIQGTLKSQLSHAACRTVWLTFCSTRPQRSLRARAFVHQHAISAMHSVASVQRFEV